MFKKLKTGDLVSTRKDADGFRLYDGDGHPTEYCMDNSRLYFVVDDRMMSTRIVSDSFGNNFKIFLEHLESR